jgi:hypothetical protein
VGNSKRTILRVSNNPDKKNRTHSVSKDLRETSNNGELQAASRSKVMNSVAGLGKGKKTKLRTKESAHRENSPLVEGVPFTA